MRAAALAGYAIELCLSQVAPYATVFEDLIVVSEGKVHSVGNIDVGSATDEGKKARAIIKEPCPVCKHPELEYYTMQLRSADEGQTVFYNCTNCGHTFNTNT